MINKLHNVAIVLVAIGALGGVGPVVASAAEFHSAVHPASLSGTQTLSDVHTTDSGTITCKKATLSGVTASKTSDTLTLEPDWNECTAFGFINVPIHENGCAYVYHASGTFDLECPKQVPGIQWTAPFCTTVYPPQHIAEGIGFTSNAGKSDIVMTANIKSEIDYNECGSAKTNGSTAGTFTITSSSGSVWFE